MEKTFVDPLKVEMGDEVVCHNDKAKVRAVLHAKDGVRLFLTCGDEWFYPKGEWALVPVYRKGAA